MALTIIDDVGSANSNSYISLADANLYFEARANSDSWNDLADDEDKKRYLLTATQLIDYEDFAGSRQSATQALKFPRTGLPYQDGISIDGIIPLQVQRAGCEMAIHLIDTDMSKLDTTNAPIESVKVGSVQLDYKIDSNDNSTVPSDTLPPFVVKLLAPFSKSISGNTQGTASR